MEQPMLPPVSTEGLQPVSIDEGETFDIPIVANHVEIQGVTRYREQVARMIDGLAGREIPLPRLNEVRQEILHLYRDNGYALVTVSLGANRAAGVVRFTVVEGHIAKIIVQGDAGKAGEMVKTFLDRLMREPVIDAKTLERYLLLAQDVPGVSLTTVLKADEDVPGALTLIADVNLKSVSGQIAADNRAFYLTGPIEALGFVDLNSTLTPWGDRLELSFFHSFPNSQNFGQLSEEWFIFGASGTKMKIYGGAGVNNPTGPLAALQYHGVTDIFGAQISYPVVRSRQLNLSVFGAIDALESTVDTGTPSAQSSADEIRVLRTWEEFNAADDFVGAALDRLIGARPGTTNLPAIDIVTARLSRGLDFLGGFHGLALPPSTARQGEQHNFTAVKFEASRTQDLFALWDGTTVAFKVLLTGQWSPNILPPAEQFYLGGSTFTRGFYSGQVPGDKALAATAELQFNTVVDLTAVGSRAEIAGQFYIFYDWGEVWQNLSSDFATRLASAGGGVRLAMTSHVELDLEALDRFTIHPPPSAADLNGIGLYWRVVARF
jgi:hemolysin activation/secretion protein